MTCTVVQVLAQGEASRIPVMRKKGVPLEIPSLDEARELSTACLCIFIISYTCGHKSQNLAYCTTKKATNKQQQQKHLKALSKLSC